MPRPICRRSNGLRDALSHGEPVHSTGLVLQELLQGFRAPKAKAQIVERFERIALVTPRRIDYIDAADLRNLCRSNGVQVGTIDALLAQICIQYGMVMLSTDNDFAHIAKWTTLELWVRQ